MKEIKFRAWDNVQEKILTVENIDFRNDYISLDEGDNSVTDTFEMFELMQYTGLKDKNGKEIYECDILVDITAEGKDKIPRVVKYNTSLALYKVPFVKPHWAWGYSDLDLGFLLNINPNKYKVIGNIYDNPELIK